MLVALGSGGRPQGRRVIRWAGARVGEGKAWSPLSLGQLDFFFVDVGNGDPRPTAGWELAGWGTAGSVPASEPRWGHSWLGDFLYCFCGGVGVGLGKGPGCGMGRACFGLNSLRAHRLGRVEMNAGEHLDTSGRWRFD